MENRLPKQNGRPSPGRAFAEATASSGTNTCLELDYSITDSLLSSRRKPRIPVRNLFKVVNLGEQTLKYYWYESPPQAGAAAGVTEVDLRPEAGNSFHKQSIPELYPTTAWVQVPLELLSDLPALESFLNLRLIIRLATAENQALMLGKGGLYNIAGIATLTSKGVFSSPLFAACNQVEQMGGTADGLILNPVDYYRLMGNGRLLADLEQNGMLISRTRMVKPGSALAGDFGHGAVLFDAGRSTIRFTTPPPGTFAQPGLVAMAQIYERVVINLPTNFYWVTLEA